MEFLLAEPREVCRKSGVFRDGLLRDANAVNAAVVPSWSNGQVKGQIYRLKLGKRMYGRAKFNLLRHVFRVLGIGVAGAVTMTRVVFRDEKHSRPIQLEISTVAKIGQLCHLLLKSGKLLAVIHFGDVSGGKLSDVTRTRTPWVPALTRRVCGQLRSLLGSPYHRHYRLVRFCPPNR